MRNKICFAYPWATFGGCERVFLNRALAFKKYLPNVKIDFLFLSDGGGLKSFNSALKKYGLDGMASVVTSLESSYDLVSLVDCPQLIPSVRSANARYIVECHTSYIENRQYLSALPRECKFVAAPSSRFCRLLREEFPSLQGSIHQLTNFVPWDIDEYHTRVDVVLPGWTRRPIIFFGRMDRLKDPLALLDAFQIIERRRPGEFMLLLCGPKSTEINIEREIAIRQIGRLAVLMPPIPFHSASSLLKAVRRAKGVFVSPSRGESYGLSAAEAISSLVPPALSNIDAHLELAGNASDLFCFPLGDANGMSSRIEYLLDYCPDVENVLQKLRDNFSARRFITDWERLLNDVWK